MLHNPGITFSFSILWGLFECNELYSFQTDRIVILGRWRFNVWHSLMCLMKHCVYKCLQQCHRAHSTHAHTHIHTMPKIRFIFRLTKSPCNIFIDDRFIGHAKILLTVMINASPKKKGSHLNYYAVELIMPRWFNIFLLGRIMFFTTAIHIFFVHICI